MEEKESLMVEMVDVAGSQIMLDCLIDCLIVSEMLFDAGDHSLMFDGFDSVGRDTTVNSVPANPN